MNASLNTIFPLITKLVLGVILPFLVLISISVLFSKRFGFSFFEAMCLFALSVFVFTFHGFMIQIQEKLK